MLTKCRINCCLPDASISWIKIVLLTFKRTIAEFLHILGTTLCIYSCWYFKYIEIREKGIITGTECPQYIWTVGIHTFLSTLHFKAPIENKLQIHYDSLVMAITNNHRLCFQSSPLKRALNDGHQFLPTRSFTGTLCLGDQIHYQKNFSSKHFLRGENTYITFRWSILLSNDRTIMQ